MIKLKGITKSYPVGGGFLEVLKGIDLTIENGEMVSIMGSSGSGKSTLLNILGILDDFDSGEYFRGIVQIRRPGGRFANTGHEDQSVGEHFPPGADDDAAIFL